MRVKLSREFLLLATVALAFIVAFGYLYSVFAASTTNYIKLNVQPPDSLQWPDTQETVWTWQGSNKQFFVWQTEKEIDSRSKKSILDYFDQWLSTHGWKSIGGNVSGLCAYLPGKESREMRGETFVGYTSIDDSSKIYPKTACVGVWPLAPNSDGYFQVSLFTINPSPMTRAIMEFDP